MRREFLVVYHSSEKEAVIEMLRDRHLRQRENEASLEKLFKSFGFDPSSAEAVAARSLYKYNR